MRIRCNSAMRAIVSISSADQASLGVWSSRSSSISTLAKFHRSRNCTGSRTTRVPNLDLSFHEFVRLGFGCLHPFWIAVFCKGPKQPGETRISDLSLRIVRDGSAVPGGSAVLLVFFRLAELTPVALDLRTFAVGHIDARR